jgi:3-dehydroquinate dehydratase-2
VADRVVAVVHGPNLNLLGRREPAVYGTTTLAEIDRRLVERGAALRLVVRTFQSNGEGAIVDFLNGLMDQVAGVVINPAAYTHTSVAIRDALLALDVPVVEVHLTNPARREALRHRSLIDDVALGRVMGLGPYGYVLALEGLAAHLDAMEAARGP